MTDSQAILRSIVSRLTLLKITDLNQLATAVAVEQTSRSLQPPKVVNPRVRGRTSQFPPLQKNYSSRKRETAAPKPKKGKGVVNDKSPYLHFPDYLKYKEARREMDALVRKSKQAFKDLVVSEDPEHKAVSARLQEAQSRWVATKLRLREEGVILPPPAQAHSKTTTAPKPQDPTVNTAGPALRRGKRVRRAVQKQAKSTDNSMDLDPPVKTRSATARNKSPLKPTRDLRT